MLVRQAQRVGLVGRRLARFVGLDHGAATARVTTYRGQRHGVIGRNQPGIDQRAQQRNGTRGVAAGVGDAAGGAHGLQLARAQLRKAIHPARRRAVRGAGVNDLDGAARGFFDVVHHGHRLARGVVVQAQDDQVHARDQLAFGSGVFAPLGGNADQLYGGHALQALTNLQPGGASFAIDKNFGHGCHPAKKGGMAAACAARRCKFCTSDGASQHDTFRGCHVPRPPPDIQTASADG